MFEIGLILFFGVHLIPSVDSGRALIVKKIGDRAYQAVFSLISLAGLIMIGWGYQSGSELLYSRNEWVYNNAYLLMILPFVLLVAANMKTHLRLWIRHPMSIGIMLWAGIHLLVNPSKYAVILSASFLLYSLFSIISMEMRKKVLSPYQAEVKYDIIAVLVGGVAYLLIYWIHESWFHVAIP